MQRIRLAHVLDTIVHTVQQSANNHSMHGQDNQHPPLPARHHRRHMLLHVLQFALGRLSALCPCPLQLGLQRLQLRVVRPVLSPPLLDSLTGKAWASVYELRCPTENICSHELSCRCAVKACLWQSCQSIWPSSRLTQHCCGCTSGASCTAALPREHQQRTCQAEPDCADAGHNPPSKGVSQLSCKMPHLLVGLRLCLNGVLMRLQPVQQRIHLLLSLDVGILLLCRQLSFQSLKITRQSVTQLLQMGHAGRVGTRFCPIAQPEDVLVPPADTRTAA